MIGAEPVVAVYTNGETEAKAETETTEARETVDGTDVVIVLLMMITDDHHHHGPLVRMRKRHGDRRRICILIDGIEEKGMRLRTVVLGVFEVETGEAEVEVLISWKGTSRLHGALYGSVSLTFGVLP